MATIRVWRQAKGRVDVLDLEEYLRGVVPAEMPASWPGQALAAQAVAARTYALRAIAHPRHASAGADLCDTAQCQAYGDARYASSDEAVAATAGETWPVGDGSYKANCGRRDCPACKGTGGTSGRVWPGDLCQWGARAMAVAGADYRAILTAYYGGVAIEPTTTTMQEATAPESSTETQKPEVAARWHAEEAVREIEAAIARLQEARQRLLDQTIHLLGG